MGKFCKRTLIPFEAAVPMGGDYDAVPFFSSSPGMTTMATTAWPVVSRRTKKQRKMMARGRHRSGSSMFEAMFDQHHHHPTHHRHELVDDDEKFELSIDVPGVKEEDIDVKLEDGLLTVQGHRMASSDSSSQFITSKFSKSFSLDKTVDVEQITAELKNGVLTVSAPKDMKRLEENVRRIPVTAAAAAAVVDLTSEDKSDENAASTSSNEDDDDGGAQKTEHKENKEEKEEAESMDVDKEKSSDNSKDGKE